MHKTAINDQTNTKKITVSNEQQTNNNKRKDTVCRESNVTERKGCVMRSTKSNGSAEIDELEENIAGNIRTLTRTSGTFSRPEDGNGETSGDNLSTLLRRVSEASTREIESLINELHGLRKKLESHGERHILRETLTNLETKLPPSSFLRISRSIIVNLERVKAVQFTPPSEYWVILQDGKQLLMTRGTQEIQEKLQYPAKQVTQQSE